MPHVSVKLYPGRPDDQKAELARAIAKDVIAILRCGEESVSVAIEDAPPGEWVEKVYKETLKNSGIG
jgi:4-oxalocrotonate tautomerase